PAPPPQADDSSSARNSRRRASETSHIDGSRWILAENVQLKLEKQQLTDALSSATEKAEVAQERSRVLAKQAALKVRGAEARRVAAEEAAREAEGKAFSLSATVQVLKSTAAGVGLTARRLSLREIEAEVTA
ncbi:unnamed protein product, partial [Pylaiella littoralis]